jgi:molybdopterin-guanine dinucleotide biosynthesis protein A
VDCDFPYDNPDFVEALLPERDSLYRETVVLKDQLSEYREAEHLKASYEKAIRQRDIEISSLKQQVAVLLRKI